LESQVFAIDLPHHLHSPSFILKTKHHRSPSLIRFCSSLSIFTSSPSEVNKGGKGSEQKKHSTLIYSFRHSGGTRLTTALTGVYDV